MAVHQAAKLSSNPKQSYDNAVKRISKYLKETADKRLIYNPDSKKGLEVYVDVDLSGSYDSTKAKNPASDYSRTGFIIKYANCPITWKYKLQADIALSTIETEYISLSLALRETIPLLQLLREIGMDMSVRL